MDMRQFQLGVGIALLAVLFFVGKNLYVSVPAGHVAVATLFGQVQPEPYSEGLHVPVNPLYQWTLFDAREKTHKDVSNVPSQDQLQTRLEVSVQYRIQKEKAADILRQTGTAQDVVAVHLIPKLRSVLREQGKNIKRAEDFFQKETQENLQTALLDGLSTYLTAKGVNVEAVLIRDISLPEFIVKAIEAKKEREQAVERQRAELDRFKLEQDQTIASAEAQKKAAQADADRRRTLADAQAYEINKITQAVAGNTSYIQLEALKTLKSMAQDPAAKIYFVDGQSSNPIPLMHIGEASK